MPFYLFKSDLNDEDLLVIFWTYEFGKKIKDSYLHNLRQKIGRFLNHNPPFDKVLFITHEKNQDQFNSIKNFFSKEKLAYSLKIEIEDMIESYFDVNGNVIVKDDKIDFSQIRHRVILDGLEKIFNRRGGMINPSQNIHYILPSGKHSNVFVRIGNILKKGVEINFVGFTLLPYLRMNTINIYCDTSSITVAAQAAVNLKKTIDSNFVSPNIESFSSYRGLNDYNFMESADSLFLISVSSSGGLGNQIFDKIRKQTGDDYIVTLFKLPIPQNNKLINHKFSGSILCDLDEIDLQIDKSSILSFESKCKLCENKSTPIEIIGDEFLTEKQETIPILIREKYMPEWFKDVLPKLLSREYISCHRVKRKGLREIRELYLDLDKLHKEINESHNYRYNVLFEKYLNQKLPAALSLIIYLNDEASFTIATQIEKFYLQTINSTTSLCPTEYVDDPEFSKSIKDALPAKKGTILVVASSISQSHSIIKISRDLRESYSSGYQINYFIAAVRTESKKEFDYIKNTLTFGNQFKADTNVFDSLIKLFIPDERHRKDSPWKVEINKLNHYLFKMSLEQCLDDNEKDALNIFKARFNMLKKISQTGLVDNLFWKHPKKEKQEFTPGFVFFNFDHDFTLISQADVYFTISSVLHYMRTDYKEGSQIVFQQSEHQRKIIDPENFSRFNDGVIQSSIIRAAYEIELDYSHDVVMSQKMKEIIINTVIKEESATYEFLLALAIGKIKLIPSDMLLLVRACSIDLTNWVTSVFLTIISLNIGLKKKIPLKF